MDEQKKLSYMAIESVLVRQERTIKRIWILCILLLIALIGTNGAWIYYESQFETVESTTITQDLDADSGDAIINDGVHLYGESETDSNRN